MKSVKQKHVAMLSIAVASLALLSACAATELKSGAQRVLVTHQPAAENCQFLGTIIGEQGGALTGGWTSNKNLAQGAMNDMKNQAVDLGANYVVLENSNAGNTMSMSGGHGLFSGSGQQTDVTHTGNAYFCPPKKASEAPAVKEQSMISKKKSQKKS